MYGKKISIEEAVSKARYYCSYQERCHKEVLEKLYSFGLSTAEAEFVIAGLIEDNFLNEERFAIQYAGGKFRMKKWGKKRITLALQQKQISPYCIKKALRQITDEDYRATLLTLASTKWQQLKGEKLPVRKKKLTEFLVYKGYEYNYVQNAVEDMETTDN